MKSGIMVAASMVVWHQHQEKIGNHLISVIGNRNQ